MLEFLDQPVSDGLSTREKFGLAIIATYQQEVKASPNEGPGAGELPTITWPKAKETPQNVKVGILGAGAAGLYAAMIINSFNDEHLTCEILESNLGLEAPVPRQGGGRLYTHHFTDAENEYFDLGAMRFPKLPNDFHKSINWLFDDAQSPIKDDLKLIPYTLSTDDDLNLFNGILLTSKQVEEATKILADPFWTGVEQPESVKPLPTVAACTSYAIKKFRDPFKDPKVSFEAAWHELMQWDAWSTRQYMRSAQNGPQYSPQVVDWLETFNTATSLYDCALSESVMDSLDFGWADDNNEPEVKWRCVQGGAGCIADAMAKTLHDGQIKRGNKVTKLAVNTDAPFRTVDVYVNHETKPDNYSHVITTLPFGCLRMVDTSGCHLTWDLQSAIRMLHYDSSVKIGMRFKERWWEKKGVEGYNSIAHKGGVSSTDRPSRVVVYPSYGIDETTGATMIVSYTWAQDALRIGALATGKDTQSEKDLITSVLHDLAVMHKIEDPTYLRDLMLEYKIHDWYADGDSCGAFAMFGPGQFNTLYKHVTVPAAGVLHFAGEATSVHHAWVEGALCSAFRSVMEILVHEGRQDLLAKLKHEYKGSDDYIKWPIPNEVTFPITETQVAIGREWEPPKTRV